MTREQWQEEFDSGRVRDVDYETMSGVPLDPLYSPANDDVSETVGWPGQYPYTRGAVSYTHLTLPTNREV